MSDKQGHHAADKYGTTGIHPVGQRKYQKFRKEARITSLEKAVDALQKYIRMYGHTHDDTNP